MSQPPLETSARERVRATRLALSVDSTAIALAVIVAIAVLVGLVPSVPW
jgi:hypothetical protein